MWFPSYTKANHIHLKPKNNNSMNQKNKCMEYNQNDNRLHYTNNSFNLTPNLLLNAYQ